jgi:hypothetical protein
VHHHHELVVVGRQQEPLRSTLDAAEALSVEHREGRVECLQRGNVRRPRALDRMLLDERVELAPPRFDLGQLGQLSSSGGWTPSE